MSKNKNLVGHKFTKEEQSRGGKATWKKRLDTFKVTEAMQQYLGGTSKFTTASFTKDLLELSAKDRLAFLMAYMPYERPKLETVKHEHEVTHVDASIEEIQERITDLLTKTNDDE